MSETYRPRIAVLASGGGTTVEAFIHATQNNVNAEVGLVVCNNPPDKVGVYDRIKRLNDQYGLDIKTAYINGKMYPGGNQGRGQTLEESQAICDLIASGGYDHVALMGYMKEVRGALIDEYGWHPDFKSIYQARMTNTHPGPLPETTDTYGIYTSQRVLKLGMFGIGASRYTMHLVSSGIDLGPIVAESPVDVLADDTPESLFARVQTVEKRQLPIMLGEFLAKQHEYLNK